MTGRHIVAARFGAVILVLAGFVGVGGGLGAATVRAAGPVQALPLPLPVNAPPVATADVATTPMNTTLKVTAPGVLANDVDPDGDSSKLQAILRSGPAGSLALSLDGGYTYTPPPGFVGPDTFTYCAWDGLDCSLLPATVTITVIGAPAATPTPAPSPTPTPKPSATPTPTLPPLPTLSPAPTLPPLPTLSPAPTLPPIATPSPTLPPGATPTPSPDASAGRSPTPSPDSSIRPGDLGQGGPVPSERPDSGGASGGPVVDGGSSTGSATGGSGGSGGAGDPEVPPPPVSVSSASRPDALFGDGATGFGSAVQLAAPAAVLAIPGLIVALVAILQALGGLAWMPVVRRALQGDRGDDARRYRYIVKTTT